MEKSRTIINLEERKLAFQKLNQNILIKAITNERLKQKNHQSSGSANSELST